MIVNSLANTYPNKAYICVLLTAALTNLIKEGMQMWVSIRVRGKCSKAQYYFKDGRSDASVHKFYIL
jgi:hypothetical protein